MRVHRGICAKLQGGFLKRWWAAVAVGALMIIAAAILAAVFPKLVDVLMNREIALRDGGRTFNWWRKPPVTPRLNVYIYNVTNADEFLNDGEKPALVELGPYVYLQQWEKVELKFNDNDTLTYKMKKVYNFAPNAYDMQKDIECPIQSTYCDI
ncbi:Scavenger receptor class B member [Apis cerana cerana]|uniref:Scavenger receptor class B member 1 n=1 Tax=Apis cerana cerana TaxID=94128 RepID=A0A2A3E2D1_APICC|nr:Scavenger receptor class B member [Apis cerana cerana]